MKHLPATFMRALLLFALITVSSSYAVAGIIPDAITVSSLVVTANYNTIQVTLNATGDGNGDAIIATRYWRTSQGSAYADTAVSLQEDFAAHTYKGVILWVDHDQYTVEVTVDDPDGGGGTWTQNITPPAPEGHGATRRQIWVSPSGSSANDGLSSAHPKQTIAQAVAMLSGDQPGQQIRLLPGVYHETVTLSYAGSAGHYNSIVGDGDPDSVVIDGSDTTLANASWTAYQVGGSQVHNIWQIAYTPAAYETIDVVVAGWGQRLYEKPNLTNLASPGANEPDQGFWLDKAGHQLYVRLEGGADPNATTMHCAIQHALVIYSAFWRAESLTTRFSHAEGIRVGDYEAQYATNSVIRNCRTYNNFFAGVFIEKGNGSILVDSNYVWDGRVSAWGYLACKGHNEEAACGVALINSGTQNVVRNNTITGVFDGMRLSGSVDKTRGANSDVYKNRITDVADDGIEFDDNYGVNQAFWGNYIHHTNYGISLAPIYTGPTYIVYNVVSDGFSGGVKQGTGGTPSSGVVHLVHNTFTSSGTYTASWSVGGRYSHKHFANNIFVGRGTYMYPIIDDGLGRGDTLSTSFDNDLLYAASGSGGVFEWGGTGYSTLANLRSALGWELHGVAGTPAFVDSSAGNYRPTSTSPSIDIGQRVMGINTPHLTLGGSAMYSNYPDAGAYDYNSTAPPAPTSRIGGISQAGLAFRLSTPRPNPSADGTAFVLDLGTGHTIEASIFDVTGRLIRRLVPRQWMAAGAHDLVWDGRDDLGARVGSGVYLIRMASERSFLVQRMVRLR